MHACSCAADNDCPNDRPVCNPSPYSSSFSAFNAKALSAANPSAAAAVAKKAGADADGVMQPLLLEGEEEEALVGKARTMLSRADDDEDDEDEVCVCWRVGTGGDDCWLGCVWRGLGEGAMHWATYPACMGLHLLT